MAVTFSGAADFAKEHPLGTAAGIFVGGLLLLYMLGYIGHSAAPAGGGGDGGLAQSYYAAEAAQTQAGAAIQIAQGQTVAQTAMAKIAGDTAVRINQAQVTGQTVIATGEQAASIKNASTAAFMQQYLGKVAADATVKTAETSAYTAQYLGKTNADAAIKAGETSAFTAQYLGKVASDAATEQAGIAGDTAKYLALTQGNVAAFQAQSDTTRFMAGQATAVTLAGITSQTNQNINASNNYSQIVQVLAPLEMAYSGGKAAFGIQQAGMPAMTFAAGPGGAAASASAQQPQYTQPQTPAYIPPAYKPSYFMGYSVDNAQQPVYSPQPGQTGQEYYTVPTISPFERENGGG